jgi:cytochrome c oxidase subunit 2
MRFRQFSLFSLLFASCAAHADWQLNLPLGVTPVSHDIYDLHMTILWICVAIGAVVFGTIFYSVIHHRKAKGVTPATFHECLWLELTWTIIPCLILILMAIPATKVLIHMRDSDQADLTIKITGFQWKWRYEYLDQDIHFFSNLNTPLAQLSNQAPKDNNYLRSVDHPLVVPIHKKIRFLITSNDVLHSWWVPDLGVKQDAVPGYINEGWTRINKAGIYVGQCAELCGLHHAFMPIVVIAMSENDFENWIKQQKGEALPVPVVTATTTTAPATAVTENKTDKMAQLMQQGQKIFDGTCAACHQTSGEGMPPTFPALKGSKIATGPRDAHIALVLNGKSGTAMQAFKDQFSDDDLAAVITYERNAWGNSTGDIVLPADIKAAKGKV